MLAASLAMAGAAHAQAGGGMGGATLPAASKDRLAIQGAARVIYDNNAAGGSAALAQARGLSPEDVTYIPSVTFALQQPIGKQLLFLQGSGDIERHDRNKQLDSENGSLTGGVLAHVGPCDAALTEGYSRRRTAVSDLVVALTKNIAEQQATFGQLSCQAGSFTSALSGGRTELTNSGKSGGYVDSTADTAGVQLGFTNKVAGTLSLIGQYSRVRYDVTPLAGGVMTPGYQSYAAGLMYKRMVGRRLDGDISITYSTVDAKPPSPNFSGWTSEVGLNYRVTTRLRLELRGRRAVEPSTSALSSFTLRNSGSLGASYALSKRLEVRLSGSAEQNNLKGGIPLLREVREDKRQAVAATVSLKMGRNLAVELSAQHSERDADLSEFDEKSDRVSLALLGTF